MASRNVTEAPPVQAAPYGAFCLRVSADVFDASAMIDGALGLCQESVEDWGTDSKHCAAQRLLILARDALMRISEEVSSTEFSYSSAAHSQLSNGERHAN